MSLSEYMLSVGTALGCSERATKIPTNKKIRHCQAISDSILENKTEIKKTNERDLGEAEKKV